MQYLRKIRQKVPMMGILGISVVGLLGYSIMRERQLTAPPVVEAIKLLMLHQQVRLLLGYPISYKGSLENKVDHTMQDIYRFKVVGPRASTEVQLVTNSMTVRNINQYKAQQLATLEQKKNIKQLEYDKALQASQKSKRNRSLLIEVQSIKQQLAQLNSQVETIIHERTQLRHNYFIPSKKFYSKAIQSQSLASNELLPEDAELYGVKSLAIELPNRTFVNIINDFNPVNPNKMIKPKNNANQKVNDASKDITLGDVHSHLVGSLSALSPEELEQYSRHKTKFMYQKYSSYRFGALIVTLIGFGGFYLYFRKHRLISLSGSTMNYLAQQHFETHPTVRNLMRERGLRQLKWSPTVVGGMRDSKFSCSIDVHGLPKAKVSIQGTHTAETDSYQWTSFTLSLEEAKQKKVYDLLK